MATHSSILAWEIPRMGSLADYSSWGCKESDTTERLTNTHTHTHTILLLGLGLLRQVCVFVGLLEYRELMVGSPVCHTRAMPGIPWLLQSV